MFEMIVNEDCQETMKRLQPNSIDLVLTSPPYNTGRPSTSERSRGNHEGRYDVHMDTKTPEEFIQWCIDLFAEFDRILVRDGVVLWNMSYANDGTVNTKNNGLLWLLIAELIQKSNFTVADRIIWKKRSGALPNNSSKNKLTRVCEDVFVFCRKSEYKTFNTNKQVTKVGVTGQQFYSPLYNFLEAKNNDEVCPLNKATYSSELCEKLLEMYIPSEDRESRIVYDPFMGTGTTAIACKKLGIGYLGSEISLAQCEWAERRINGVQADVR